MHQSELLFHAGLQLKTLLHGVAGCLTEVVGELCCSATRQSIQPFRLKISKRPFVSARLLL